MAYIGQSIKNGTFAVLDTSGNTYNGSNTTFSLGTQVGSPAQLLVSHDGVVQKPGTDYTLATGGTQITFTTAPASGASIFIVEISGAVGGPMNRDINGDELILDVDGDTSITADTDDQIDFKTGGSDRVTIDSSGQVGIGTTSPSAQFHVNDDTHDGITAKFVNSNAGNSGANVYLIKDSSSPASGDNVGVIQFRADDDAGNEKTFAAITAVTEDASAGSSDGSLRFGIRGNASTNELIRLTSSGLHIGGTGSANALSDYEEGTFNMTLEGGTGNPTVSYNERSASYTKIGNIVQVHGVLYPSSISGGSGNVIITGFPFTASQKGVGALIFDRVRITNASAAYPTTVSVVVEQSTTYMTINEMNDNSDETRGKVNIDDLATNPYIAFSVTYRTTA